MLIGAQKSGTTSLFDYICKSPEVIPPLRKEVHYFDQLTVPQESWYRAFFCDSTSLENSGRVTGEATPFYLFHPEVPYRIACSGLRPKFIAILRCPVERAWSHYRHEQRKGRELLTFSEALRSENQRLRATTHCILDEAHLLSLKYQSYLARGRYMTQLERYIEVFGKNSIHVLSLDQLKADLKGAVYGCCDFLGVDRPLASTVFSIRNADSEGGYLPIVDMEIFRKAFDNDLKRLETILPEAERWRESLHR